MLMSHAYAPACAPALPLSMSHACAPNYALVYVFAYAHAYAPTFDKDKIKMNLFRPCPNTIIIDVKVT